MSILSSGGTKLVASTDGQLIAGLNVKVLGQKRWLGGGTPWFLYQLNHGWIKGPMVVFASGPSGPTSSCVSKALTVPLPRPGVCYRAEARRRRQPLRPSPPWAQACSADPSLGPGLLLVRPWSASKSRQGMSPVTARVAMAWRCQHPTGVPSEFLSHPFRVSRQLLRPS